MKSRIFGPEPVITLYILNALIAFLVTIPAFGLSHKTTGWVLTLVCGSIALTVAIVTRPWVVSALTGAVATILTGAASFGLLPVTQQQSGALVMLVSAVLGLVLRANVSPAAGSAAKPAIKVEDPQVSG